MSIIRSAIPRLAALALLYAGALGFANPAAAQSLTAGQRAEIEALRTGEMRKLVFAEQEVPAPGLLFTSRDGTAQSLADSNGRMRVVNFWATWCAPCREEFPALDALAGDPPADVEVIPIATGRNTADGIDRFLDEANITTLVTYLDPDSSLAHAMNVLGLPVTIILSREGTEIARLIGGADWNGANARAILGYLAALPG